MSAQYELVNQTKNERITYAHLEGSRPRELAGNPCQAAVTTWYLLQNQGDEIQFLSDSLDGWPFRTGKRGDEHSYPDKTFEVVNQLIEQGILKDIGYEYMDEDEPGEVYVKKIINVWMRGSLAVIDNSSNL